MPSDRFSRDPLVANPRVPMRSLHDVDRRNENSFLLYEPPSDGGGSEKGLLGVKREFASPIPGNRKSSVQTSDYRDPTFDVSVLELKAEVAHLASQLEAVTEDSQKSASMNQRLRLALEEEVARNDELSAQVKKVGASGC